MILNNTLKNYLPAVSEHGGQDLIVTSTVWRHQDDVYHLMRELGGLAVDVPGDDDEVSVGGHEAPPHRLTHLQRLARAVSQELSQM